MSQLQINPLAKSSIISLTRTSGIVTVVLTTSGLPGFAPSNLVIISNAVSAAGTIFNGTFNIASLAPGETSLTYSQPTEPDDTANGGTATAISALADLPDSYIAANQPWAGASAQTIAHNAKYGTVRTEEFTLGFYGAGNVVNPPVSPVDGYIYSLSECTFKLLLVSSRQPAGGFVPGQTSYTEQGGSFIPGQVTFPILANNDIGTGDLLSSPLALYIDPTTGVITCQMYFYNSPNVVNQGTILVTCTAQRALMSSYLLPFGSNIIFVDAEVPSGSIPGSSFTLANMPNPPLDLLLMLNGLTLEPRVHYTIAGNSIQLSQSTSSGDSLIAWYLMEGPGGIPYNSFVGAEIPSPASNLPGNVQYYLSQTPTPSLSLLLTLNGVVLRQGTGFSYTLSGPIIFLSAPLNPGDVLIAWYRTALTNLVNFSDAEIPTSAGYGWTTFSLANAPNPAASLRIYLNGLVLRPNVDFTLVGSTFTLSQPIVPTDWLSAWYRY